MPVTVSPSCLDVRKPGLDNEDGAAGEGKYDEEQLYENNSGKCVKSAVINELSPCWCQTGLRGGSVLPLTPSLPVLLSDLVAVTNEAC